MKRAPEITWQIYSDAESYLRKWLLDSLRSNRQLETLAESIEIRTAAAFFDWIDHFSVGPHSPRIRDLENLGFSSVMNDDTATTLRNTESTLPPVLILDGKPDEWTGLAIRVDAVSNFLMANSLSVPIEGSIAHCYRRSFLLNESDLSVWIVERRGYGGFDVNSSAEINPKTLWEAIETWKTRPRQIADSDRGVNAALTLADEFSEVLGKHMAAWVVITCEVERWMTRNRAGSRQHHLNQMFGLGFANIDHVTFRSSRKYFPFLIKLFEKLGFESRERFYAGDQAGWGAQVMEDPVMGKALFLDVDLNPDEIDMDFLSETFDERNVCGTVGLWCELHGDSILDAGLHHVALRMRFNDAMGLLAAEGIPSMAPFSLFPYLKQVFTFGEMWSVPESRITALTTQGIIHAGQEKRFKVSGAVGSHLEIIQRRGGFKGFNQTTVSNIIRDTDPRDIGTGIGA
ncbi:hypothetical protein JW979_09940 [bacterium]|nr:hypothetical protein [candidate division CSSED10-310 bacterium]